MSWKQVAKAQQHYFGQITHIDHQIGRLFAALRWRRPVGRYAGTVTSDHGDMMGDYGLFFKGHFFEGSGRVPMILRPPRIRWDRGWSVPSGTRGRCRWWTCCRRWFLRPVLKRTTWMGSR